MAVSDANITNTNHLLELAHEAKKNGNIRQAIDILTSLSIRFPELSAPHINLAIIHADANKDQEALQEYTRAIEVDPGNSIAHNGRGITLRKLGKLEEAKVAYEKALHSNPEYAYAHLNLGILLDLYMDNKALAVKHYKQYLEYSSEDSQLVESWLADLKNLGYE